jgi:hypothetical protein
LVNTNVGKSYLDLVIQKLLLSGLQYYFLNIITIKVNQETHHFSEILKAIAQVRLIIINTNWIAIAASSPVFKKIDWSFRVLQNSDKMLIGISTPGG